MSISLHQALYRRLHADSAVVAIVADRIWEDGLADGVYPCIEIQIDENADEAITERPAKHYDIYFRCMALTPETRNSLATAVKASLNRANWTDGNVSVVSTLLNSSHSMVTSEGASDGQDLYETEISIHFIAGV